MEDDKDERIISLASVRRKSEQVGTGGKLERRRKHHAEGRH